MREQAIDLRLALRSALFPSGDSERILGYLREAETLAAALDDPRRLGHISGFLSVHFRNIGAMTRPSLRPSALSRSLQPARRSSCTRWQTNVSASPTSPRGTIDGPLTVSGKVLRPSTVLSVGSASVKPMCPRCNPWPTSLPVTVNWACLPRAEGSGKKDYRLLRQWRTPAA